MENYNAYELHRKVLIELEKRLAYYKMLERYTRKSVKLKQHRLSIKLMKEVIEEAKNEYELYR